MTVEASTPTDAAASPSHPDHARWVKERTLALEVQHAQLLGGTLRDAEDANRIALARLASRNLHRKPKSRPTPTKRPEPATHRELADAKVFHRSPKIRKVRASRCGNCGMCIPCKRQARAIDIIRRHKAGEFRLGKLVNQLAMMTLAFDLRMRFRDFGAEFPFDSVHESVRLRALDAVTERICDRSSGIIGEWR